MRPIELELSGLHSYRDTVRVDFERLGEHGLFGIFGSIGSGKSTLLDGITLALYGIVDRTNSRSRAGIVNHHSSRIEVRLRFSLTSGGEPELYEVHRVYRRTQNGSAERVNGRLCRIESGQAVVLADKEREITEAVTSLLGLEPQDFMRAVVLPQGRFMRFLHLKGAERRAMLQRIFRLTAYGADLRRQIKLRREQIQLGLQGHRGELVGIGDASKKAMKEAKKARAEADAVCAEARERFESIEATWEQARLVRERQTRLAAAETALAQHLAERRAIEALRERLALARRAEALRGPHARLTRATSRVDACQEAVLETRAALREATEGLATANEAFARARADRVASAPGLQKRQSRLEQALEVALSRDQVVEALTAERARHVESERRRTAARDRLEALEERARVLAERRTELGDALANAQVDAGARAQLTQAVRAHDRIRALDQQRTVLDARRVEAAAPHAAALAQLDAARSAQAEATQRVEACQARLDAVPQVASEPEPGPVREALQRWADAEATVDRLRQAADQATRAHGTAEALVAEARSLASAAAATGNRIAQQLDDARAALAERAHRHRAALLARDLEPDAPCPVCGSTDHPEPAAPVDLDELPVQLLAEGHQRAERWLEAAAQRLAVREDTLSRASERLDALRGELQEARRTRDHARAEGSVLLPIDGQERAAETRSAYETWLRERRDQAASAAAARDSCRQELADVKLAAERAGQPVAAADSRLKATSEAVASIEADLSKLASELSEAWDHFEAVRGSVTLFDVPRLQVEMARKDAEAQRLLPEIKGVEQQVQQVEDDLSAARAESASVSVAHSQVAERVRQLETQLTKLDARLEDLAPEGAPAKALQTTRTRLQGLEQAELHATEARDAAREQHAAALGSSADAEAEQRAALQEYGQANRALLEVQTELGMREDDDPAALLEHALGAEERARLEARLDAWDQRRIALRDRVDQAEQDLGEERVDARTWETLDARRTAARAELDQARSLAHTAALHHQDLEARAERYAALQEAVAGLEKKQARLEQLNQLVRGDRFVDYLANDYLRELVHDANRHLHRLTDHRYTLVLADDGNFEIRDADGGGSVRPVHTLSGGETFVASLALALALSTQVQARSQHPLEFFFLDEGFGSLDAESLDRVMGALESLRQDSRTIGLISHLPSVRERVPRYLEVSEPGRDGAVGTTVSIRDN